MIFICYYVNYSSDQLLNIIIILIFAKRFILEFNLINEFIVNKVFLGRGLRDCDLRKIFIVIYISFSGAYFIPLVLDSIYSKIDDYPSKLNEILKADIDNSKEIKNNAGFAFIDEVQTGKCIGILERILITILIISNQFTSIGFIIAIKSLARFKMMDNKIFSEYYIVGTLISLVYTFVFYFVINYFLVVNICIWNILNNSICNLFLLKVN